MKLCDLLTLRNSIKFSLVVVLSILSHEKLCTAESLIYDPILDDNLLYEPDEQACLFREQIFEIEDELLNMTKTYRFNGTVLIGYKNKVVFEKTYGYANPINKSKLTLDHRFELASVSKQFTAVAVLNLVQQGLVHLDSSVSKYISGFRFENITVRHLLNHRSGLWNYMYLVEKYWSDSIPPTNKDVIDLINQYENRLNFSPGTRFNYSNTGYAVLASLVESVSCQTFEGYFKHEVLYPLGLTNVRTFKDLRDSLDLSGYQPYRYTYLAIPPSQFNRVLGDKGVYSTADDLFEWLIAIQNYSLLNEDISVKLLNADNGKYAMGFRNSYVNEYLKVYHNGLWDGFRNGVSYFPDLGLSIIVLSHTQCKGKTRIQNFIQNRLVQSFLGES
ncbi:serine hydrolase domain-containing protein [Reichenbachiella versicolor]|uniref:serine hydrolase domain-containing protein n=1 Tax=Reichenbachiella versicolor TaxID=1821036 RepID=UPI000D6EAE38|nr:serine hydrolase [Reichenbachiella versicolor]